MKNFVRTFMFLTLPLMLLTSCGQEKKGHSRLTVTLAGITDADYPGGVIISLINASTGAILDFQFSAAPYVAQIPLGQWQMSMATWAGPSAFTGQVRCGQIPALTLTQAQQDASLTVTTAQCSSIIAPRFSKWDTAKWDRAVWRP